ncbi:MAG: ABC transporter ATP-binding protein [Lachnospiraceae bacterium]|nr:ABC transporter ATP-binding protein [Lachnospiraceae bacterium]
MIEHKNKKKISALAQEKGTWKRFLKLVAKSHLPYVLIVLYVIADLLLINVGISETDVTAQLFAGDTSVGLIMRLVTVMIINIALANLVVLLRQLTDTRIKRNARLSVWNKLLHIPMSFFKDEGPQEAITRVVNNASAVGTTLILVVIPLATSAYGIIASLLKVFSYDPRLSAILLAFVPVNIFLAFVTGRLKRSVSRDGTDVTALLTKHISELITNIPLAKAFHKEKYEEERGNKEFDELYKINIRSGWIDKVGELAFSVSDLLQTIVIVVLGVILLRNESITRRAWVSFFMFSSVVAGHVQNLIVYWHNSKNIQGIIARAAEIMDAETEDSREDSGEDSGEGSGTLDAAGISGDIKVSGVAFSYDEDKPILSDITCTFEEGRITALIGKSGSGKTTLVNLIDRIYEPDAGEITIGETGIKEYDIWSYRKQFAVVPQNVMLFSGSIRENICFGPGRDMDDREMSDIIHKVGLDVLINDLPEGIETDIGERGERLSGGQKQKIAIARMILSGANYIILDESAASMDTVSVGEIRELLKTHLKGKTVIMIAHGPRLLSLADNAVVIDNGSVAACGSMQDVCKKNAFCRAVMKGAAEDEA